jgi:hypothetical protein
MKIHRALLILVALLSVSSTAGAVTLLDLQNGDSIIVDGLVFFDFRNITTAGTISVDLADITVDPLTAGGPSNNERGLRFSSTDWVLEGANQNYDLAFDFSVRTLSGADWIIDNTLEVTGGIEGEADIDIAEGVTDHATDQTLANKFVFIHQDDVKLIDHQEFAFRSAYIDVSKNFAMRTLDDPNARAFVSHFDQTFSTPEPGTMAMLGSAVGLTGLGWIRRRRSRSA